MNGGNSFVALIVVCLAGVGVYFLIQQFTGHTQAVVAPTPVLIQCQDGSIQATCPPIISTQVPPPPPTQDIQSTTIPFPTQVVQATNVPARTCEAMVNQQLGGPGALGGDASAWTKPDWAMGAWTYYGSAAELHWPGFGWFDTWPDHGGSHLTHDFMSPPGDANTAAASFHCQ